jgi:hypothetical protein
LGKQLAHLNYLSRLHGECWSGEQRERIRAFVPKILMPSFNAQQLS